ncbi:MAG: 50S ribosomal protein L33 [Candidatus Wildermuthbacteria bacterium]|nr:50S ribosomal protein L33 [Candidatus Wildermuthbacteria bacterium]
MAAKKKPFIKFQCASCKEVNYFIKKSKEKAETKLELKKFCRNCRKRTAHKETKK